MDIGDAIGDRDEPEAVDGMDYDAGNDDMYYPSTATDSEMGPDDNNLALPVEVQSPISTGAARFRDVDDDDLRAFTEAQKNRATLQKTISHVKLFPAFLRTKNETQDLHQTSSQKLDNYLGLFFIYVKKPPTTQSTSTINQASDDCEYEPCALRGMQAFLDIFIKQYEHSIITSDMFFKSRDAIASKCRELKKQGKGNQLQKPLLNRKLNRLTGWDQGSIGCSSQRTLQHSMWWVMSTRFGKRANKENVDMRWGDVCVKKKADGLQYLVANERTPKHDKAMHPMK